jgi:hypothetical protein
MGKSRQFKFVDFNQSNFVIEWQDDFNQQGYLDDLISIPLPTIGYVFDGLSWFRTLASPFYLEDVIFTGKIGFKKQHLPTKPYRFFIFAKDMVYQDQWALDYVQKKRLGQFPFDVYGDYSFQLIHPERFLKYITDLDLELGTIEYLTLTKKLNNLLFLELASLSTQAGAPLAAHELERNQQQFHDALRQRFLKIGFNLVSFNIEFHSAKS